jgi:nitroreductase
MYDEKLADIQYPIHEPLQRRWSPRAFADRPIERDKLIMLLEAFRWAPSSYNDQPWSLIVATKDEQTVYAQLLSCLIEFNQQWAKQAPLLMLSIAKLEFENGKSNRHAHHDVGAASENLVIQATVMDLFVHQMAGFDVEKAIELFQIPQGYEPMAMIAIGYRGDVQTLSEELQNRDLAIRNRKSLKEFVFTDSWGKPSPIALKV